MFEDVTCTPVGKVPDAIRSVGILAVAIFVPSILAEEFTSALTIVPSSMLVEVTTMSLGNVPLPNFARVTESSSNLEPFIFAELLTSASTIEPLTMLSELTVMPALSNPSAILVFAISALAFISALTIVPSAILEEVTAPSSISWSVIG